MRPVLRCDGLQEMSKNNRPKFLFGREKDHGCPQNPYRPCGSSCSRFFLKYFDAARFALFDHCGVDPYRYTLEKKIAFPVTHPPANHVVALGHNDSFLCKATVTEAEYKIAKSTAPRKPAESPPADGPPASDRSTRFPSSNGA